ncbi:olfactory receptor 5AR1-like [Engystomops pustulosus]|uniref:olfactory receptor 5AR1-like n=1 Tax=Engystomops pustulosus TaxID=76066 RepID=UPI003AFA2863
MNNVNHTLAKTFILLGLANTPGLQLIFFLLFLLMYTTTLSGNLLLIIMVRLHTSLQTPMYFFLSNLAFIDICFSSTIVPKLLASTISNNREISFVGCAMQMYFHLALGAAECLILAVMAYDRYIAICKPLQYNTIIDKKLCLSLVSGSWTFSFFICMVQAVLTFQLPFCKSNHLNHYFCEMPPLFRLSCRDTWINEIVVYIGGGIIALCSFILTLLSYVHIISTILNINSIKGRQKAFSTCGSHLTVVSLYYGTIMFMYFRPRSLYSPNRDRAVSILYTVVTPMLNPIIYSVRNKDFTGTIKKAISFKLNNKYV